ncbi:hypothetical protein Hanom_Chr12g01120841 [Helianthus anomalus]
MSIHQFKRKPNKYEKTHLGIEPRPISPKTLFHPKMTLGYKVMYLKQLYYSLFNNLT